MRTHYVVCFQCPLKSYWLKIVWGNGVRTCKIHEDFFKLSQTEAEKETQYGFTIFVDLIYHTLRTAGEQLYCSIKICDKEQDKVGDLFLSIMTNYNLGSW